MKIKLTFVLPLLAAGLFLTACETDGSYTTPTTSTPAPTTDSAPEPTGPITEKGQFEAGPIWDQADAETKCPALAKKLTGTWDGNWVTTRANEMSVCTLGPLQTRTFDTAVPMLFGQSAAEQVCPDAAKAAGGEWNGQWTNQPRPKMPEAESVCGVKAAVYTRRTLEAGPIWNQADAETKCPALAKKTDGTWNGAWWTTVAGKMSVCQIDS